MQPHISDLSFPYVLNIGIQGVVLCVEKITTVVTFLSYFREFESRNSVFHFFFIVLPCILIKLKFLSTTNAPLYYTYTCNMLKYTAI